MFQVQPWDPEVPRPLLPAPTPTSGEFGRGRRSRSSVGRRSSVVGPAGLGAPGMGSWARDGPTHRIRAEAENFQSPSLGSRGPEACAPGPDSHVRRARQRSEVPVLGRSSVVGRGSRSPVHGVKGPRRTDSPHQCRGRKFSKSKPGIPRSRGLCPRAPTPTSGEFGSGQRSRSSGGRRSSVAGLEAPAGRAGAIISIPVPCSRNWCSYDADTWIAPSFRAS